MIKSDRPASVSDSGNKTLCLNTTINVSFNQITSVCSSRLSTLATDLWQIRQSQICQFQSSHMSQLHLYKSTQCLLQTVWSVSNTRTCLHIVCYRRPGLSACLSATLVQVYTISATDGLVCQQHSYSSTQCLSATLVQLYTMSATDGLVCQQHLYKSTQCLLHTVVPVSNTRTTLHNVCQQHSYKSTQCLLQTVLPVSNTRTSLHNVCYRQSCLSATLVQV